MNNLCEDMIKYVTIKTSGIFNSLVLLKHTFPTNMQIKQTLTLRHTAHTNSGTHIFLPCVAMGNGIVSLVYRGS